MHAFETVPLVAALAPADRVWVQCMAQTQTLGARKTLFAENTPFTGLHILLSGNIKLVKAHNSKEQILEILEEGDVIDPIPLFDGGNHAVTAKTMTPIVVYRFAPSAAQELIVTYPPVLNALLNVVSARLRKLATLANDLAFKDVTARVCSVLLEQAARNATAEQDARCTRQLTRQDLAAMVGTAREVAWRALKKLEHDGLIEIHGPQIIIVDPAGLALRA